ncbi:uroporphyrinogen-III C-methyltransferase [Agarivorans sp. Z349TD_8]|uniref:uroporphyrinogen-III C-methyltransferase n=1 Tax=Agarivorans sp. Z349TD_8 TaxID=3421434 RepID=UPI003D7CBE35
MHVNQSLYGVVSLVGAGPGDPELLTLKALKTIQAADVIVYDKLVSQDIQTQFPAGAEQICVGKAKGKHSYQQDQINRLLRDYAQRGYRVCRLKGGDALVFGRGSEEMLYLARHGIQVNVVPGITAASGCSTYANIPLTHRGLAQGCSFITAHAEQSLDVNWQALAQLKQTLVIYMGLSKVRLIQSQLMRYDMDPATPVAIIENGCTAKQRQFIGQLDGLENLASKHQLKSPALIVIGKVVTLASQLATLEQDHLLQFSSPATQQLSLIA